MAGNCLKLFQQNFCFSVHGAKMFQSELKMRFFKFYRELKQDASRFLYEVTTLKFPKNESLELFECKPL